MPQKSEGDCFPPGLLGIGYREYGTDWPPGETWRDPMAVVLPTHHATGRLAPSGPDCVVLPRDSNRDRIQIQRSNCSRGEGSAYCLHICAAYALAVTTALSLYVPWV